MDAERIRAEVARLPLGESLMMPTEYEVWQGEENDARFMLSRSQPPQEGFELLSLSVVGPDAARRTLIEDFSAVFGEPTDIRSTTEAGSVFEMASWLVLARDFDK